MKRRTSCLTVLIAGLLAWSGGAVMGAGEPPSNASEATAADSASSSTAATEHPRCELHGGQVIVGQLHIFETVYAPDRMCVYLYSPTEAPLLFEDSRGLASVRFDDGKVHVLPMEIEYPAKGEKTVFFCPMHPEVIQNEAGTCKTCGMKLLVQNRLCAKADLSTILPDEITTTFHLYGVPGDAADVMIMRTFKGLDQLEKIPTEEPRSKENPKLPKKTEKK